MQRTIPSLALIAFAFGAASATHHTGCVPGQADPRTINVVDLTSVSDYYFYVEERAVPDPLATTPPLPLSGFLLGEGTAIYYERNAVTGLQRGYTFIGGACIPAGPVCLIAEGDPILDETCHHGPDAAFNRMYLTGG